MVLYSHLPSNWSEMHHISLLRRVDYLPYSVFNLECSTSPFLYSIPVFVLAKYFTQLSAQTLSQVAVYAHHQIHYVLWTYLCMYPFSRLTSVEHTQFPGVFSPFLLHMTSIVKMLTYSDSHSRDLTEVWPSLLASADPTAPSCSRGYSSSESLFRLAGGFCFGLSLGLVPGEWLCFLDAARIRFMRI